MNLRLVCALLVITSLANTAPAAEEPPPPPPTNASYMVPSQSGFAHDFGSREPGVVLMVQVGLDSGCVWRNNAVAGGQPVWQKTGEFVATGTMPEQPAGRHDGQFTGEWRRVSSGGEGEGEGDGEVVWLPWDGSALAVVGKWKAHQPITGAGPVTKTEPTGPSSDNLYYDGTGNADIAIFVIDVSEAKDMDRHSGTGEIADAGLNEARTEWIVDPAEAGEMDQGTYVSTFTPSTVVYDNIEITAKVYEGEEYSAADGDPDEPDVVQWGGVLRTFKVGVRINPGNMVIWDDDDDEEILNRLGKSSLATRVPYTGLISSPGTVEDIKQYPLRNVTWTAVAETSSGSVQGIRGSICFSPEVRWMSGHYHLSTGKNGALPVGGTPIVDILVTFLGKASGYVAAGLNIARSISGSLSAKAALYGQVVIENAGSRELEDSHDMGHSDGGRTTVSLGANLDYLGPEVMATVGHVIKGSIIVESQSIVNDESLTSEAAAVVREDTEAEAAAVSNRPTYAKE